MKLKRLVNKIKIEILVFVVFVLYRIPFLGFDIINTDAPVWKTRTFEFSSALFSLNFAGTNVTYHPGVTLMWLSAAGVKFYNLYAELVYGELIPASIRDYVGLHFTQKLVVILFLSFVLAISFYLLKKITNIAFATLFVSLLFFEPYFVGLTRVLHTDGLVTTLSFASVISIYYYLFKNQKLPFLVLSSFFTALALLTKSNALFLLGFIGVVIFFKNLKSFKNLLSLFLNTFKSYFTWLFFVLVLFTFFWPAMWVTPITTLQNYYSGIVGIGLEPHLQAWFGVEVDDPGPTFYPIIFFIRSTPYFLLLTLCGVLLSLFEFYKTKKINYLLLFSFMFAVLYVFFLSISDKKLGRYLLPVYPFAAIFASYFLYNFLQTLCAYYKNIKLKTLVIFSFITIFLLSIVSTIKIVPDYYMYYSPLVGGFTGGRVIEEPKWPIGYRKLANYLNSLEGSEDRYILVRFGYLYNPFNISGETGTLSQKTEKDPGAYFILEKYSDYRYLRGKGVVLKDIIKVGGVDYFWIYEIIGNYDVTDEYQFIFLEGAKVDPRF